MNYYKKYLKYKFKYLNIKKLLGDCIIDKLINEFIENYEDIIFDINKKNRESLKSDDFPTTCVIINDKILLDKNMIRLIYSKTCHMIGIIFIQYLINNNKIHRTPCIKIHVLNSYSYIDIINMKELNDKMFDTINQDIRSVYIDKIINSEEIIIDQKIKDELRELPNIEKENNNKALNFIKKNNTISRILINRDELHEFVIININNKLYLLQTNIYNLESQKISKIELSIEDIENIFNNNINDDLYKKINFKINQYDGFFINAFYGYDILE